MNVGFDFIPRPEAWYLFHREYGFEPKPSYCKHDYARIVVRTSTDQGRTWSNATVIAAPAPNGPFECALTDGAGFFDTDSTEWHYLSQCNNRSGAWNLCHFSVKGESPLVTFQANPANPVVYGGQLFERICGGPWNATNPKHCSSTVVDEGTPEIVRKSNGYFFVTFHGFDYKNLLGVRGVAKTKNFVQWEVEASDLPGDVIFSQLDCSSWSFPYAEGGCVGGGEASILEEDEYMYEIIEAPDLSLGCGLGKPQWWPLGLMRAKSFFAEWSMGAIPPQGTFCCACKAHRMLYPVPAPL